MNKIIVTLGPSTKSLKKLKLIKDRGVDFVRINMSHSSIEDLRYYVNLSKKVNIPFIIDTEGSQIRTGDLSLEKINFKENEVIRLYKKEIIGNKKQISLKPSQIIDQLDEGDILYVDFDTLIMRVTKVSTIQDGFIEATIISSGSLGKNKGVVVDSRIPKYFDIPNLTQKDIQAIKLGLEENIGHVAASFMRNRKAVEEVRKISKNRMKIISKIECEDAIENLDDIISESDFLLIDRGDLSKEIPIEKIPFTQNIILNRAKKAGKKVFVATNLLESMISNRKPTRAEVNDIVSTIMGGAYGLTLAAETAIGNYPIACVNMLNKIIHHSHSVIIPNNFGDNRTEFVRHLEKNNYLKMDNVSSSLVKPHGGNLINRYIAKEIDKGYLSSLKSIQLTVNQQLDIEQLAMGTYSPLDGFMVKKELESVLDNLRLPTGEIWPLPIILDLEVNKAKNINEGESVALQNNNGEFVGIIEVKEKYSFDRKILAEKLYESSNSSHPGVKIINSLNPILIGGKISLYRNSEKEYDKYYLTPKQARRLFCEKNWDKVVGFHTRNVIHRAHEFIQLSSLEKGKCDGLFIHPVVGMKKAGDYNSNCIIKSYEIMQKEYYPEDKIVFGAFSTYSRYAGEREAIFTALCRKNYGCSHFIIGRDHTGIGTADKTTQKIFSEFPDLGIEIIYFNPVYYSKKDRTYSEKRVDFSTPNNDLVSISGSEARKMFMNKTLPPSWYMRPKISEMIMDSIKRKSDIFIW